MRWRNDKSGRRLSQSPCSSISYTVILRIHMRVEFAKYAPERDHIIFMQHRKLLRQTFEQTTSIGRASVGDGLDRQALQFGDFLGHVRHETRLVGLPTQR